METANEFIAKYIWSLESRKLSQSSSGLCPAVLSDAAPPQSRVITTIRAEICPNERCSDVDRAIIGASLGG